MAQSFRWGHHYHQRTFGYSEVTFNQSEDGSGPVSYTHLDVYKRQVKYRPRKWTFLRGVKRCSKLECIKNGTVKEELEVFNFNERLKDCKQVWKDH